MPKANASTKLNKVVSNLKAGIAMMCDTDEEGAAVRFAAALRSKPVASAIRTAVMEYVEATPTPPAPAPAEAKSKK